VPSPAPRKFLPMHVSLARIMRVCSSLFFFPNSGARDPAFFFFSRTVFFHFSHLSRRIPAASLPSIFFFFGKKERPLFITRDYRRFFRQALPGHHSVENFSSPTNRAFSAEEISMRSLFYLLFSFQHAGKRQELILLFFSLVESSLRSIRSSGSRMDLSHPFSARGERNGPFLSSPPLPENSVWRKMEGMRRGRGYSSPSLKRLQAEPVRTLALFPPIEILWLSVRSDCI